MCVRTMKDWTLSVVLISTVYIICKQSMYEKRYIPILLWGIYFEEVIICVSINGCHYDRGQNCKLFGYVFLILVNQNQALGKTRTSRYLYKKILSLLCRILPIESIQFLLGPFRNLPMGNELKLFTVVTVHISHKYGLMYVTEMSSVIGGVFPPKKDL